MVRIQSIAAALALSLAAWSSGAAAQTVTVGPGVAARPAPAAKSESAAAGAAAQKAVLEQIAAFYSGDAKAAFEAASPQARENPREILAAAKVMGLLLRKTRLLELSAPELDDAEGLATIAAKIVDDDGKTWVAVFLLRKAERQEQAKGAPKALGASWSYEGMQIAKTDWIDV